jgi:hypothetical protein
VGKKMKTEIKYIQAAYDMLVQQAITASGAATAINLDAGRQVVLTLPLATALSVQNVRTIDSFYLNVVHSNGGAHTLTMPVGARWVNGIVLNTAGVDGSRDTWFLKTTNGGVNWDVYLLGSDMAGV